VFANLKSSAVAPRFLLDTHIVIRWLAEPKKLSREQFRIVRDAVRRNETLSLSAMSLLEIATVLASGKHRVRASVDALLRDLEISPVFQVLPITYAIASEVAALGKWLRDPADRAIVATARVHHLRLLTSDLRIIESNLVTVIP
jgi:PIN domain nuclease of toxin-antitoxin system